MIEKIIRADLINKRKKAVSIEISSLIKIKKDWIISLKKKPKTEYTKALKFIEAIVLIKLTEEIKELRKRKNHLTKMLVKKAKYLRLK